jgi:hypothetical protein
MPKLRKVRLHGKQTVCFSLGCVGGTGDRLRAIMWSLRWAAIAAVHNGGHLLLQSSVLGELGKLVVGIYRR